MARRSAFDEMERKSPVSLPGWAVRNWMDAHSRRMIKCPYQPGHLVLSQESCAKRHLAGKEESYDDLMDLDVFRYRVKKGLFLCRQCPIGQRVASQLGIGLPIADAQPLQAAGS